MAARLCLRLVVVSLSAVLLAGCTATPDSAPTATVAAPEPTATPTPTPTPTPTTTGPPPLGELVLSPEGLGPLVIGQPIDPQLATFDPFGCRTPENQDSRAADDPVWEAWVPNYPDVTGVFGGMGPPFQPHHEPGSDALTWLGVSSPEIRTAEGVGIGSTRDEVLAAYPDAAVVEGPWATAYGIDGAAGRLVIEVMNDPQGGPIPEGEVYILRVDPLDWPFRSLSGTDAGGWCAVEV